MDPRRSLADIYDAHVLDRERKGEPAWREPYREQLAAQLPDGARILEVGSGVGVTARWFADRGFDVVASDLSPANVEHCRQRGLVAELADATDLPFTDGQFDAVSSFSCLMHIPDADLDRALGSIARVLADGGLFQVGTWGADQEFEGPWEDDFYEPRRFYSIRSSQRLRAAYEAVFEVVSFDTFRPTPRIEWYYDVALLRRRPAPPSPAPDR